MRAFEVHDLLQCGVDCVHAVSLGGEGVGGRTMRVKGFRSAEPPNDTASIRTSSLLHMTCRVERLWGRAKHWNNARIRQAAPKK